MDAKKEKGTILGELTWVEAKQRFSDIDVALLPVGSTEQHGPPHGIQRYHQPQQ
jgi:L-ascorbate metabolism protein UlaG (beta-lactamase superfamily)